MKYLVISGNTFKNPQIGIGVSEGYGILVCDNQFHRDPDNNALGCYFDPGDASTAPFYVHSDRPANGLNFVIEQDSYLVNGAETDTLLQCVSQPFAPATNQPAPVVYSIPGVANYYGCAQP